MELLFACLKLKLHAIRLKIHWCIDEIFTTLSTWFESGEKIGKSSQIQAYGPQGYFWHFFPKTVSLLQMDLKWPRMIEFDTFLQKIWLPEGLGQVLFSWISKLSELIFYILSIQSAKRSLGTKRHFFEKYPRGTSSWPSIKNSPDSNLRW